MFLYCKGQQTNSGFIFFMDFCNNVKRCASNTVFIQMNDVYFLFLEITGFALKLFSFVDANGYLTIGKGIE